MILLFGGLCILLGLMLGWTLGYAIGRAHGVKAERRWHE